MRTLGVPDPDGIGEADPPLEGGTVEEGSSPTLEGEGEWGEEEDGDGSGHSAVFYYLYYRNSHIDRLQLLNYRKLAFTVTYTLKFPCFSFAHFCGVTASVLKLY